MFKRAHHQRIAKLLDCFDADLLQEAQCYFGGGTAIVLSLGEYRESLDVDFLCASRQGYRLLRNTVSHDLGALLRRPVPHLREVRADRDKIFTYLEVDGKPIKVELVSEGRIDIGGGLHPVFGVPTLSKEDMFAEKLLANADRGLDRSTLSRDIIDLAMMVAHWGEIPPQAWEKARAAYGDHVVKAFNLSLGMLGDREYLGTCLRKMQMEEALLERIPDLFGGPALLG